MNGCCRCLWIGTCFPDDAMVWKSTDSSDACVRHLSISCHRDEPLLWLDRLSWQGIASQTLLHLPCVIVHFSASHHGSLPYKQPIIPYIFHILSFSTRFHCTWMSNTPSSRCVPIHLSSQQLIKPFCNSQFMTMQRSFPIFLNFSNFHFHPIKFHTVYSIRRRCPSVDVPPTIKSTTCSSSNTSFPVQPTCRSRPPPLSSLAIQNGTT